MWKFTEIRRGENKVYYLTSILTSSDVHRLIGLSTIQHLTGLVVVSILRYELPRDSHTCPCLSSTYKDRQRQTDIWTHIQTDEQTNTDSQTYRQSNRQTKIRQTDKQTGKHKNRQSQTVEMNKYTDRQKGRHLRIAPLILNFPLPRYSDQQLQ